MRTLIKALQTLSFVAAFGAAQAATCPLNESVGSVLVPGFSCTLGDKTFSDFVLAGVPASALVSFGIDGPLFAVTLSRDGTFFPEGTVIFDYKITATAPLTIREGSLGVDVSFPLVDTTSMMNGVSLTPIMNGGTALITFTPGVASVLVDDTARIRTGTAELNSLSNNFSQVVIGIAEPGSLPLMLAGLAGLVFICKRRR